MGDERLRPELPTPQSAIPAAALARKGQAHLQGLLLQKAVATGCAAKALLAASSHNLRQLRKL
eukprot:5046125-Alexandrium_andersonii.AAC.1